MLQAMQITAPPASAPKSERLLLGVAYVLCGSASYGMLSTFVKLAYKQGFSTAEVTMAQFFWGLVGLALLSLLFIRNSPAASAQDCRRLLTGGLSVGLTSCLYYVCVKYIDASVAVVLLMQSVWIGVVIEAVQTMRFPTTLKVCAVILTLLGTVLATNILNASALHLDFRGVIFGFLAALSFSVTLYSSNSIATHLHPIKRSLFMLYGGSVVVLAFAFLTQLGPYYLGLQMVPNGFVNVKSFNFRILEFYGWIVALFGTVIPPIMLNRGFPITGVGLGSILSAIELPFAIVIAFTFLGESINAMQWLGVFTILGAIVLMNYQLIKRQKEGER